MSDQSLYVEVPSPTTTPTRKLEDNNAMSSSANLNIATQQQEQQILGSSLSSSPSNALLAASGAAAAAAAAETAAAVTMPATIKSYTSSHTENNRGTTQIGGSIFEKLAHSLSGKWTRLIIYSITCLTTSCLYYGWQQYSQLLLKGGAYAWECPDGWDYEVQGSCDAQDKAVGTLYSVGAGAEYSCAVIAGIMFDHVGPRLTGFIGEIVFCIGILLLTFSSQSFQAYIPAMLLCGGCVNVIAFPSLILGELFPKFNALAVSVVLAAQTGCTIIAPILLAIWNAMEDRLNFDKLWWGYLGIVWFPVTVVYILALPSREEFAAARNAIKLRKLGKSMQLLSQYDIQIEGEPQEIQEAMNNFDQDPIAAVLEAPPNTHHVKYDEVSTTEDNKSSNDAGGTTHRSNTSSCCCSSADNHQQLKDDCDAVKLLVVNRSAISNTRHTCSIADLQAELEQKTTWKEFFKCLIKIDTVLLTLVYVVDLLAYNYYPAVVRSAVSDSISDFVGYAMPTEAFWSLITGVLIDYIGTISTFFILLAGLAFSYGLTLQESVALQYVCGCVFIFCQSTIFTPKYTYISEMFDPRHYGKLVGCLGLLGGLATFINIPIAAGDDYATVFYTYAAMAAPLALILAFLLYRQLNGVTYRTIPIEAPCWPLKKSNQRIEQEYVRKHAHQE